MTADSRAGWPPAGEQAKTNSISHISFYVLLFILLLAFGLRILNAGGLRMWGDEGYSVYSAHRTLAAITFQGAENDPHPPLYYYLLHFFMPVAGTSELALRFFSTFFGVATVPLLYSIARYLFDTRTGLLAAALAAAAPFHVYYSQEIRMYALAIFLATLATYWFVRWFGGASPRSLWLYAISMLLALYTLYHTAFVFLAEGIFLIAYLKSRRALVVRWVAISSAVVALFLPWFVLRFSSTLGHLEDRAGHNIQSLPLFIARGFSALTVGATVPSPNALATIFAALIALGLVVGFRTRRSRFGDGAILSLALVPIVAVYPLYLLLPIFVSRLFALAFAPLAVLIARSVALVDRRIALAVALVIVGVAGYSLNDYFFRYDRYNPAAEDYMPVIRAIEQDARPGDVVLFHANWQMGYFLSHYRGAAIRYGELANSQDLSSAVAEARNVWAVVQGFDYLDAEGWLAKHAFPIGGEKFGQIRLAAYRTGMPTRGERYAAPVLYDNGMALLGYHINGQPVESGRGAVTIQLDWQATRTINADYRISTRLTNTRGDIIWAQDDAPPASGEMPTVVWQPQQTIEDRHAFVVPPGTPPGVYSAEIAVYESSVQRVSSIVAPENQRGAFLKLGTVEIVRASQAVQVDIPMSAKGGSADWNQIGLVGAAVWADQITPGDALPLTLYWQAREAPARDYAATIQLVDAAGRVHAPLVYHPVNDSFPTSQWSPGEIWLDKLALKVDADMPSGEAVVQIGLDGKIVNVGRVAVHTREHHYDSPSPQHPLTAILGKKIALLGYDLVDDNLTLYWRALDALDERYTVFVHLLDASGNIVAQQDDEPQDGSAPTTSWLRGEVIADEHAVKIPNTPGQYTVIVGMYQPATGARLVLDDDKSDHVILQRITVN